MRALRLPLIGLLFALIYQIIIIFGGGRLHHLMAQIKLTSVADQYHVIPRIMDGIAWNQSMRFPSGIQG